MISGGSIANTNGKKLEDKVLQIFQKYNYEILPQKEILKRKLNGNLPNKYVELNAPYRTLYGRRGRTEFCIRHNNKSIRIECKSQDVCGTADQKLIHCVEDLAQCNPDDLGILIMEGKIYTNEIYQAVDRQISKCSQYANNKPVQRMSLKALEMFILALTLKGIQI